MNISSPEKPTLKKSDRPERNTVIGHDDILNLRIALNTSTSLEDFLRKV